MKRAICILMLLMLAAPLDASANRMLETGTRQDDLQGGVDFSDLGRGVIGLRFVHLIDEQSSSEPISSAIVQQTIKGGPADLAGIKKGDTIVAVDGTPVLHMGKNEIARRMYKGAPGSTVVLTLLRDKSRFEVTVTRADLDQISDPTYKPGFLKQSEESARIARLEAAAKFTMQKLKPKKLPLPAESSGEATPGNPATTLTGSAESTAAVKRCDDARLYIELGDYPGAVSKLERAVQLDPNLVEVRYLYGTALDTIGKIQEATPQLSKCVELNPNFAQGWQQLGINQQHCGQLSEAIESLKKYIALAPDSRDESDMRNMIWDMEEKLANPHGSPKKAKSGSKPDIATRGAEGAESKSENSELLSSAAAPFPPQKPAEPYAIYNLGCELLSKRDFPAAEAKFAEVTKLDDKFADAWQSLGESQRMQEKLQQAEESYSNYLKLAPEGKETALTWQALGDCQLRQERFTDAQKAFSKSVAISPENAELVPAWQGLGMCLQKTGKYNEALDAFKTAIKLSGNGDNAALCWLNLAGCNQRQGNIEQALQDFKSGLQLSKDPSLNKEIKSNIAALENELANVAVRIPPDTPDYLPEVTHKTLARWTQKRMPLKVYVADGSKSHGFRQALDTILRQCFEEWAAGSAGQVSFTFVDNPRSANIRCIWTDDPSSLRFRTEGGQANIEYTSMHEIGRVTIIILTDRGASKAPLSDTAMRTVALHEIGHSLGLCGHSSSPKDVMFMSAEEPELTARDKQTVVTLYKTKMPAELQPPVSVQFTH